MFAVNLIFIDSGCVFSR